MKKEASLPNNLLQETTKGIKYRRCSRQASKYFLFLLFSAVLMMENSFLVR